MAGVIKSFHLLFLDIIPAIIKGKNMKVEIPASVAKLAQVTAAKDVNCKRLFPSTVKKSVKLLEKCDKLFVKSLDNVKYLEKLKDSLDELLEHYKSLDMCVRSVGKEKGFLNKKAWKTTTPKYK